LEFDTRTFSVPWGDVPAEEAKGLQILKDERDKYLREQAEKDRQEREMQARR
jgi:hypothetical protein